MTETWKLLVEHGLPDGPARPRPAARSDPEHLRAAVAEEVATCAGSREAELLLAWLSAMRRHWPSTFAELLGPAGGQLINDLEGRVRDHNRCLKLRRIAIANLAGIL